MTPIQVVNDACQKFFEGDESQKERAINAHQIILSRVNQLAGLPNADHNKIYEAAIQLSEAGYSLRSVGIDQDAAVLPTVKN